MVGEPGSPARVLVVDDEPAVRIALDRALRTDGYDVSTVEDGILALERTATETFDAIVLDVSMPFIDGFEVTRRLRLRRDRTPILMLTARDGVDDRVEGLDAGADDYLVKPFALRELLARVRALLRRVAPEAPGDGVLTYDDVVMNVATHEVRRGDRVIELTKTEWSLLELFLQYPEQLLARPMIFERVWSYDFGPGSNTLSVYMGYLRRKLEPAGEPRLLHTVRSLGYILRRE